ncbi:MAG: YggS family pyridoxal phosphate-dependent enzyme [Planctomycetes bacterium]|nr:YggS family pyridoxal phosphate-dependent enzyme [Planctomycetota bacterium]
MQPALTNQLADNARRVRERIAQAALRVGRDPRELRVVAVTKYVQSAVAAALWEAGEQELGENRVQELEAKAAALSAQHPGVPPPIWHLIGSLQTNKIGKALRWARWIHSVDRPALWTALEERLVELPSDARPRLLLQVNVSGEATKHGFTPDELRAFLSERGAELANDALVPAGLMTMAPLGADAAATRACFDGLAALRDEMRARGAALGAELSMGMSQDFEHALAAGATILRIGSAFFEGLA